MGNIGTGERTANTKKVQTYQNIITVKNLDISKENQVNNLYNKKNPKRISKERHRRCDLQQNIYCKKKSNQEHDSKKTFIDYGATSHMVKLEGNMTKLKYSKTLVTVGDSITLTWENVAIGTAIRDLTEEYLMKLSNATAIPGGH